MPKQSEKLLIGLTGPIGSGKSLAASVWERLGAGVVSGDEMGRLALLSDAELRLKLSKRFGNDILDSSGSIITGKLAEAAFATPESASDLTKITFPTLNRLAHQRFTELSETHSIVVYDAALIFEWGIEQDFDKIVVVTAPIEDLINRASKRLHISREQAKGRLHGQISNVEKVKRADIVIMNDGSIEELKVKAHKVWEEFIL
ncbi:dephospho-CoA kinase [bacterium]|nr:dephospho-CoA kinase [bacterium]